MYPPSMAGPAASKNETVDATRRFSELYFGTELSLYLLVDETPAYRCHLYRLCIQPWRSPHCEIDPYLLLTQINAVAPEAMKGRCPDSLFCGLARLDGWKWHINSTQYANIMPSEGDVVYGSLFFLSPRDEAGLDESEGVPWLYEKKYGM